MVSKIIENIPNFHTVTDTIHRGGQPSREQLLVLKESGFKSIINLRSRLRQVEMERQWVEKIGMFYHSYPLRYWLSPDIKDMEKLFSVLESPDRQPVFIHCFHGADRTGIVVAAYRIMREDWTFEEAYREMVACGFHRIRVYHYKLALKRIHDRFLGLKP